MLKNVLMILTLCVGSAACTVTAATVTCVATPVEGVAGQYSFPCTGSELGRAWKAFFDEHENLAMTGTFMPLQDENGRTIGYLMNTEPRQVVQP